MPISEVLMLLTLVVTIVHVTFELRGNSRREKNSMKTTKRKSDRQRFPKPRSLDLLVI